jgi:hypothetical protein
VKIAAGNVPSRARQRVDCDCRAERDSYSTVYS